MTNQKRTKIVATLGPSCNEKETLRKMILEGVDVFRINFSHAEYGVVEKNVEMIMELREELETSTAILADLQGPKLRIGTMKEEVYIEEGKTLYFCSEEEFEGTHEKVYMDYETLSSDVNPGEIILIDDGKIILEVQEPDGFCEVKTKVVQGGLLQSRKGVNLPNTNISLPALTLKDKEDVMFAIKQEV